MTRSPLINGFEAYIIVGTREDEPKGSKWDYKPMGKYGIPNFVLRKKVYIAVNLSGHSYGKTAKEYGVSRSYVKKWARIGIATDIVNKIEPGYCKVGEMFKSISNRPKTIKKHVSEDTRGKIVDHRRRYHFMGSAKIKAMLGIDHSCSTIDRILIDAGLLVKGKKRKRNKTYGSFERDEPFELLQIDYKEWKNGAHTMFVLDDRSRTILGYSVSETQSADETIRLLEDTIRFWRITPKQILSDHGTEFHSVKGESKLSKWCKRMGIDLIHGRVKHPQTQGKIERSHRSAMTEIESFGQVKTMDAFRKAMSKWVEFYNTERPHQSLGYDVPLNVLLESMNRENLESFIGY